MDLSISQITLFLCIIGRGNKVPIADEWDTSLPAMNIGRNCYELQAVNGRIYVIGGHDDSGPRTSHPFTARPRCGDLEKKTLISLPKHFEFHTMAFRFPL